MDRIVVALTGASGAVFGIRALELLRRMSHVETHLIVSRAARSTIAEETSYAVSEVLALGDHVHADNDLGAAISSGSFATRGMLVAPCSIKTLSGIANSYDENLVVRAGDVTLKERRRLVLMVRETPLHAGHLRLMTQVTEAGGIVMPPVPAFYSRPHTIDDIVEHTAARALDLLGLHVTELTRWSGRRGPARPVADAAIAPSVGHS